MLEFDVYEQNLDLIGILEVYSSCIWQMNFYTPTVATFEMPATPENIRLIRQYNTLVRPDTNEAVYIRAVAMSADKERGEIVSCTAVGYDSMLYKRSNYLYNGNLYHFINTALTGNRKIPNLRANANLNYTQGNTTANVGSSIEVHLLNVEKGLKSVYIPSDNIVELQLITPVDRSVSQSENSHVVFSDEYDNLIDASYSYTDENAVNTIHGYVTVPEDVYLWDYKPITYDLGDNHSGFERWEENVSVDATLTSTVESFNAYNGTLTVKVCHVDVPATTADLKDTCQKQTLNPSASFEGTVMVDSDYDNQYGLGDMVTVTVNKWNLSLDQRIVSVLENIDHTENKIEAVFGHPKINLYDKLIRL